MIMIHALPICHAIFDFKHHVAELHVLNDIILLSHIIISIISHYMYLLNWFITYCNWVNPTLFTVDARVAQRTYAGVGCEEVDTCCIDFTRGGLTWVQCYRTKE